MSPDVPEDLLVPAGRESLRSDLYSLLASLLGQPPSADGLNQLADLRVLADVPAALASDLIGLKRAAAATDASSVKEEYADLFIGMGRGELVPYASWYHEKLLMAGPLARLRTELANLGICRQSGASEPEDHAGALCEIMVLIIAHSQGSAEQQATFFHNYLAGWMIGFFRDLQQARSAAFYRYVGRLGEAFMLLEKQRLQKQPIEEVRHHATTKSF
jgi:TorA maturation chaperone TorD